MKTKTILISLGLFAVLSFFSFKNYSGQALSKTIIISMVNGGDNEGFNILYGDGKKEIRPFTSKIKAMNTDTWIGAQQQAAVLLNEFREKGYRYVGSHTVLSPIMILEKE